MTNRRSLSYNNWPAADQTMWETLTRHGGPLDGQGAFAHLRPASLCCLEDHYGKWLKWLSIEHPQLLDDRPETRLTPEHLRAFLAARADYAPYSRLMIADAVLRILQGHAPEVDWSSMRRCRKILKRQARQTSSTRKQGRILSSRVILDRAMASLSDADVAHETSLMRAKRKRDGALVAFLALLPIRARALSDLRLGTSVTLAEDAIWILLSEDMTKNGQPWEAPLPAILRPLIEDYILTTRPWLLSQRSLSHDVLWVNDRGHPFSTHYISVRVSQITERLTGVPIPVHFFRDCAATTLARQSPSDARLIRPLLGHMDFETADQHYVQAQRIEAGRDYAATLAALKSGT